MSTNASEKYHPGTCEATEWGKRYGKNLTPQTYDDPKHLWHLAKSKNWMPWSCCGRAVNSPPCQLRPAGMQSEHDLQRKKIGVGCYIKFLINGCDTCLVVGEALNVWKLDSGRIAKKCTQHTSWVWLANIDGSNDGDASMLTSTATITRKRGVGGKIKFLINNRDTALVVGEEENVWRLDSGRIAKKNTIGKSWIWIQDYKAAQNYQNKAVGK